MIDQAGRAGCCFSVHTTGTVWSMLGAGALAAAWGPSEALSIGCSPTEPINCEMEGSGSEFGLMSSSRVLALWGDMGSVRTATGLFRALWEIQVCGPTGWEPAACIAPHAGGRCHGRGSGGRAAAARAVAASTRA
jgi:hypothetical protein